MSRFTKYIIEKRTPQGALDLSEPQPDQYFGAKAYKGITVDEMADVIFRNCKDAVLHGTNIPAWPANIHKDFVARVKYWADSEDRHG